jgi:hypothetical protein
MVTQMNFFTIHIPRGQLTADLLSHIHISFVGKKNEEKNNIYFSLMKICFNFASNTIPNVLLNHESIIILII